MASSESTMRQTVNKLLKKFHAVSVENGVGIGTPDVNCSIGWLELKSVDKPKKPDTVVDCRHFTNEQKIWLLKRWRAGGMACLLLKVGDWWLLFDPQTAYEVVGKVSFDQLVDNCFDGWHRNPTEEDLAGALLELCSRKTFREEKSSSSTDGDEK